MEVAKLKEVAAKAIDAISGELGKLSSEIWSNPELYYQEKKAHALLTDYLEQKGFTVERSYKLPTAFRATCPKTSTEGTVDHITLALLCEYDALPGIGHACGHNLIAEVGIGASIGVKAALDACSQNLGKLVVLGTPAEEEGNGKIDLINGGAFKDIDVAMMSHPSNCSSINAVFVALQEVRVRYFGRSSHAAASPWEGINALDAAVMAYSNISCLRQQMRQNCRVHGIITKGGVAPSIIPHEAELFYYIRAPTKAELDELVEKIKSCFEAAAIATGCEVECHWDPKSSYEMITNQTIAKCYKDNARKLGVTFWDYSEAESRQSGSTDMGNVSHVVPAIHPLFFIGGDFPVHSVEFAEMAGSEVAQPLAVREAKIMAWTALDVFCQSGILKQIKQEFDAAVKWGTAATPATKNVASQSE